MAKYWLGVVSRSHVLNGVANGFTQLNHGKRAPLQRMQAGDWLVMYSPKMDFNSPEPCQRFTAIGRVRTGAIYQADMGGGFVPYRMDMDWLSCREAPIQPLIPQVTFIADKKNWGYQFRFGHLQIPHEDFVLIAEAMDVDLSAIQI